jgi:protease I
VEGPDAYPLYCTLVFEKAALAAAGVIEGKACSAYPAVGPGVTRAGDEYVDIPVDQAHVDGNLVTAPAWPAHPD